MTQDRKSSIYAARSHSMTDTRLFAALVSLGIPPVDGPTIFAGETLDGTPKQTWFVEKQSVCGQFQTEEMIKAWHSKEWMDANPNHPLAYLKAYTENVNVCIDFVKARTNQMHVVRGRGGKLGVISPNDNKRATDAILRTLNR